VDCILRVVNNFAAGRLRRRRRANPRELLSSDLSLLALPGPAAAAAAAAMLSIVTLMNALSLSGADSLPASLRLRYAAGFTVKTDPSV